MPAPKYDILAPAHPFLHEFLPVMSDSISPEPPVETPAVASSETNAAPKEENNEPVMPPPLPQSSGQTPPPHAVGPCPCGRVPPRRSSGIGCIVAAIVGGLAFVGILVFLFCVIAVPITKGLSEGLAEAEGKDDFSADASGLRETEVCVYEPTLDDSDIRPISVYLNEDVVCKAIRIPLTGTIDLSGAGGGLFGGENSTELTLRSIRRATEDSSVDAILLEVDSGGGGITASDILYHALVEFKKSDPDRRIVVLMGDMACSGGYYASLPADCILAHPTTITGSIGVILTSINVHRLTEKLGIVDESITSGENKSILNPMRELTDDQRDLLQDTVNELHERFTSLVAKHRKLPPEEVRKLADGRIYTARQAKELGLIDDIGYLEDAMKAVGVALGNPGSVEFYQYERKNSLRDIFSSPDFWGAAAARALSDTATADSAGKTRVRSRF